MNKIINFLSTLIWILFSIIVISCSDSVSSGNEPKIITSLSGYIKLFNPQINIVQTRIYHDSTYSIMGLDTIGIDSLLNLQLTVPQNFMLKPISEIASRYGNNLAISNSQARGTDFLNIRIYGLSTYDGGTLWRTNREPITVGEGVSHSYFAYADRNVSINGTVVQVFSIIGSADTSKYNVNINMAKGWNVISYTTTHMRDHLTEYSIQSGEPGGMEWYYRQF